MKIDKSKIGNGLIDVHTHYGFNLINFYKTKYPIVQDTIALSQLITENNISFAVTFPMPNSIYYDVPMLVEKGIFQATKFSDFPFEKENLYLLTQVKVFHLKNILPFCSFSLNDKVEEQVKNLEELAAKYDIYGLKFHTQGDHNSILEISKHPLLLDFIEKYNLPLMVHTGNDEFSNPLNVLKIAQRYSHIRFCAAHLGRFNLNFFDAIDKNECSNLFIDTAPFTYLCEQDSVKSKISNSVLDLDYSKIEDVFDFFTNKYPDKILWGTDTPWTNISKMKSYTENNFVNYQDEVKILLRNRTVAQKIANNNPINFLFGYA
jgi:predicted TIM-barrel fold metal-dependent hydrolase